MLDPSPFQTMALNFCKTLVQALVIIKILLYNKDVDVFVYNIY